MKSFRRLAYLICLPILFLSSVSCGESILDTAPVLTGNLFADAPMWTWVQAPNSHAQDVLPPEAFKAPVTFPDSPKTSAAGIFGAWSGGVLAEKDGFSKMYSLRGGGHADYAGNQNLAFNLYTLKWELLKPATTDFTGYDPNKRYHSMPSNSLPEDENGNPIVGSTGATMSAHTYGGLGYNRAKDELFMIDGGPAANSGYNSDSRWSVSLDGKTEIYRGGWETSGPSTGFYIVEDTLNNRLIAGKGQTFYELNDDYTLTKLSPNYNLVGGTAIGVAIDSARQRIITTGTEKSWSYSLVTNTRTNITGQMPKPLEDCYGPGFTYAPALDKFVGWCGGNTLYLIDPVTLQSTEQTLTGTAPTKTGRGLYGRFAWSDNFGGIIVAGATNEDVAFVKLGEANGIPVLPDPIEPPVVVVPDPEPEPPVDPVEPPANTPIDSAGIRFGNVWCPSSQNSGEGFHKVTDYNDLPNDPIGDGRNNCYMEATDTSMYSTDGKPLNSCANLDLSLFPEHECRDVVTSKDFKNIAYGGSKLVSVVNNDILVEKGDNPYLSHEYTSRYVIGAYNSETKRPVLVTGSMGWGGKYDSSITIMNLRIHSGTSCLGLDDSGKTKSLTLQSVTGKCYSRFFMSGWEKSEIEPLDNTIYFKNVMARAHGSHTIYMDRSYLNWVEDSLIMGSWTGGKHSAKYTGQNVIVKNTLQTNEGVHGYAVDDPDWKARSPRGGVGGLAPISMASCNRAVLDNVTIINHVVPANSNPQGIQWQFRDALGAGCDMPRIYRTTTGDPQVAYYGAAYSYENKQMETPSSAWSPEFWENPPMLDSWLVNSRILTNCDGASYHGICAAVMSDGTYPAARKSGVSRYPSPIIPEGWKERQRIHLVNNQFEFTNLGTRIPVIYRNHRPTKATNGADGTLLNTTNRFIENSDTTGMIDFMNSLPQPVWMGMGGR